MPKLFELIQRLQIARDNIPQQLDDLASEMGLNAIAMAERELIQNGVPGKSYSTNPIPSFFLNEKWVNARGEAYVKGKRKRKKKGEPAVPVIFNWRGLRDAEGFQTAYVDLFHSGYMQENIIVVRIERKPTGVSAVIGGKTEQAQKEMDYNYARYGDWFNIFSDEIRQFLLQLGKNRVDEILKNAAL